MKLDPQPLCRELKFFPTERGGPSLGIPEYGNTGELGNNLLEQLQPLSSQLRDDACQPCDVATGPRQALDEPSSNGVSRRRHNDRDGRGSLLGSQGIRIKGCDDNVWLETDEIGGEIREALDSTLCITVLNPDVLALNPSEVGETLSECLVPDRNI